MTSDSDIDRVCESISLSEQAPPPPSVKPTACKPRKRWPWLMFLVGIGPLVAAIWFDMCGLQLEPATRLFPFRTAGWFILGLPILLPISVVYSAVFSLVSIWIGRRLGWIALLAVSGLLISLAVWSALPTTRLGTAIGPRATAMARIERLEILDSFRGDSTYRGTLIGDDRLLAAIIEHRGLQPVRSTFPYDLCKPSDKSPVFVTVYRDAHSQFFQDPQDGRIYFTYREFTD